MSFQPPYASVLCAVNGGAPTAGAQVVTSTSWTLQFSAASTAQWNTALWELYDYPPGYVTPSGWTLDPVGGSIYYAATGVSPNPPPVTIQFWGKLACRLTVNGAIDPTGVLNVPRMVDATSVLTMASPNGLWGLFVREGQQIGSFRRWVGDHKKNLRTLDTFMSSLVSGATPQLFAAACTVAFGGPKQVVGIDTSAAGTYNVTVPAATGGQELQVDDDDGTWVAHGSPGLIFPTGVTVENPQGSAIVTGPTPLFLTAAAGVPRSSYRWTYYGTKTFWKF